MSTRCQIGFYRKDEKDLNKWEALIYRHSDGYPEGVLPELLPFLKWFDKARGMSDTEYVSARCLQYLCNSYDGMTWEMAEKFTHVKDQISKDFTGVLGYGICNGFHGDIEYFYAVYPKKVVVYSCGWDAKPEKWNMVKVIDFALEEPLGIILEDCRRETEGADIEG